MQYASILLAASAALVSSQQIANTGYQWTVQDWTAGCARSCSYEFTISGPEIDPYPSFTATCSGYDTGAFVDCTVTESSRLPSDYPSVLSLLAPNTGDGAHLQVSLIFEGEEGEDGLHYNITGAADATFNRFSGPPSNFVIVPGEPLTV